MVERLGNVVFWLGMTITVIMFAMIGFAVFNGATLGRDGVALALRAGARIADIEFVQFHPTVMWLGPLAQGQQPLVSAKDQVAAAFRDADLY